MADPDVDAAQEAVDEQAKWGETFTSRAVARLLRVAKRTQDAIVDLRQRVKALEDRFPPS